MGEGSARSEWHEIDGGRYKAGGRWDCRARMLRCVLSEERGGKRHEDWQFPGVAGEIRESEEV
jgi:hypothetical protein